jgi:hypothetical protein
MAETIHDVAKKISERQYGCGTVVGVTERGIGARYIDFEAKDSSFGESITVGDEDTDWYATNVERFEDSDFDYRVWFQQRDTVEDTEEDDNPWREFYDREKLSDADVAERLERLAERAESSLAEHDCKALAESLKLVDDDSDGSNTFALTEGDSDTEAQSTDCTRVVIAHGVRADYIDYHVGVGIDLSEDRTFICKGIYAPVDTASAEKIRTEWFNHETDIENLKIIEKY